MMEMILEIILRLIIYSYLHIFIHCISHTINYGTFLNFIGMLLMYERVVCLFCCFMSQVNSYGHGRTVSLPNHTFFLGKLEQTVNQYYVHILWLVTDNNPS